MLFLFVSVLVPVFIWSFFPWMMKKVTTRRFERNGLLLVACLSFFVSWYLPSPLIHGMQTQLMTHIVGGGIFSGLLFLYVKKQLQWNPSWLVELIAVFALVSSLGVINELFELATVELHLTRLSGADTWWDLLANTVGAILVWISYRTIEYLKSSK